MTTIISLPVEVIVLILENECISMEDVVSFICTCKNFQQELLHNRLFWEKKFYQRYFFILSLLYIQIFSENYLVFIILFDYCIFRVYRSIKLIILNL